METSLTFSDYALRTMACTEYMLHTCHGFAIVDFLPPVRYYELGL
jgi:hypothetical protein